MHMLRCADSCRCVDLGFVLVFFKMQYRRERLRFFVLFTVTVLQELGLGFRHATAAA